MLSGRRSASRLRTVAPDGSRCRICAIARSASQRRHRLRRFAQYLAPDGTHVLHEGAGEIDAAEIVKLGQRIDLALDVIDRAATLLEAPQQIGRRGGGKRMRHRLEKGVAAALVVEGLDSQHCATMT
jgi:hypothetical protein